MILFHDCSFWDRIDKIKEKLRLVEQCWSQATYRIKAIQALQSATKVQIGDLAASWIIWNYIVNLRSTMLSNCAAILHLTNSNTIMLCNSNSSKVFHPGRQFWEFPNLAISNLVVCNTKTCQCGHAYRVSLWNKSLKLRLKLWVQNCEKCRWTTFRQLDRASNFSGTIRGAFPTFCCTFLFAFRFGIVNFSGQFRSAEVPCPLKTRLFASFTRKPSLAPFCALLCSPLRSFARVFTCLHPTAFRMTAFWILRQMGDIR